MKLMDGEKIVYETPSKISIGAAWASTFMQIWYLVFYFVIAFSLSIFVLLYVKSIVSLDRMQGLSVFAVFMLIFFVLCLFLFLNRRRCFVTNKRVIILDEKPVETAITSVPFSGIEEVSADSSSVTIKAAVISPLSDHAIPKLYLGSIQEPEKFKLIIEEQMSSKAGRYFSGYERGEPLQPEEKILHQEEPGIRALSSSIIGTFLWTFYISFFAPVFLNLFLNLFPTLDAKFEIGKVIFVFSILPIFVYFALLNNSRKYYATDKRIIDDRKLPLHKIISIDYGNIAWLVSSRSFLDKLLGSSMLTFYTGEMAAGYYAVFFGSVPLVLPSNIYVSVPKVRFVGLKDAEKTQAKIFEAIHRHPTGKKLFK